MIPENIKQSLDHYVKDRWPTGGFLRLCLENDFMGACEKADQYNIHHLRGIAEYMFNNMPMDCYGSPEKVSAWLHPKPGIKLSKDCQPKDEESCNCLDCTEMRNQIKHK